MMMIRMRKNKTELSLVNMTVFDAKFDLGRAK